MLLIKNGHIISPQNNLDTICDILIENGRITELNENISANCEIIDAEGKVVLPGFIDKIGRAHV